MNHFPTQQEVERKNNFDVLRLAFHDLTDEYKIIFTKKNPFIFPNGVLIQLEEYRLPMKQADRFVLFTAGIYISDDKYSIHGWGRYVIVLENEVGGFYSLMRK